MLSMKFEPQKILPKRRPFYNAPAPLLLVVLYCLYSSYSIYNSNITTITQKIQALGAIDTGAGNILDALLLDFTRNGNFSLSRAPSAAHLERRVDSDPLLGICTDQKPMLEGLPEYVCRDLQCLWVEELQVNIDLARYPLRILPGPSESRDSQCGLPTGGQRPVLPGALPHISFILTMHNSPVVSAQCLLELFRTSHEVPSAEFVIIDDGSTYDTTILKQTIWRLQQLFKIQIILKRNEAALGYGPANEEGIRLASGKYIALINNDMFVVKGWLSAIMQTFNANPKAGIIGPMFLGNEDLITEAGGLIFNDAGAANYARGREPHHEIYFMRKADYISAACVVFQKDVYHSIGGFDPQYIMGYYEDTDLAMATRAAGLEVIFQPLAINFHQEGGTFGTDSTSDLKRRLMEENKAKFFNKWKHILQMKHCPSDIDQFYAFKRAAHPALLWVDDIVPEPDRDSGSIRNINLLSILLEAGFHVSFAPTNGGRQLHYTQQLRHMGVHVFPVMPPEQWMLQHNGKCMYDVIMVARRLVFEAAQGQLQAHCPGVPIIYDTVDLHFLREARDAITALGNDQGASWDFQSVTSDKVLEWLEKPSKEADEVRHTRDSELYFIDKSNLTVVVSAEEMKMIRFYRPNAQIAVVSNIHNVRKPPDTTCEGRIGTLFVGNMNHIPNRQALEGLIKDVLPLVVKALPSDILKDFKMNVVGSNVVPDNLKKLFEENEKYVTFHSELSNPELYEIYGRVKVAVAPLLSGAGVKGKVNQAMKLGVPVVATPIAVEGMHGQDGVDCLIANNPNDFTKKIVELHTDCNLWRKLSQGGYKNMIDHFSVAKAKPIVLEAFTSIGRGTRPDHLRGHCPMNVSATGSLSNS